MARFNDNFDIVKKAVAEVLQSDIESRDDDNVLMLRVWEKQGLKPETRFSSFKKKIESRDIAMPKSIERARRELQSKHIILRGDKYAERHNEEQSDNGQTKLF